MQTLAVVMERPEQLALRRLDLVDPGAEDVVVDIAWSGISTGTEKLLWTGAMPPFPVSAIRLCPVTNPWGVSSKPGRNRAVRSASRFSCLAPRVFAMLAGCSVGLPAASWCRATGEAGAREPGTRSRSARAGGDRASRDCRGSQCAAGSHHRPRRSGPLIARITVALGGSLLSGKPIPSVSRVPRAMRSATPMRIRTAATAPSAMPAAMRA